MRAKDIYPHFIFNALSAIQFYIQKNDQDKADEYLTQFATLMRLYLKASNEQLISISTEIELLKHYLDLEQMRFEDLFTYEFVINEELDTNIQIPTMILQPLAENAVNHGLRTRRDGNGKITLTFEKENNDLFIKIADNGIGMAQASKTRKKNHESRALHIIKEKLDILSRQGLMQVSMSNSPAVTSAAYPGNCVEVWIRDGV